MVSFPFARRFLALLAAALCLVSAAGHAISIDKFKEDQAITVSGLGGHQIAQITGSTILGGTRSIETTSIAAGPVQVGVGFEQFFQYESIFGQAVTAVSWDGDSVPGLSNFTGLGHLDLTADGAANFKLILSFDFPAGQPLTMSITAYDASDPTGKKSSTFSVTIAKKAAFLPVLFPFSAFTTGPGGAADLKNIGAVTLVVKGNDTANDIEISFLGTDGSCADLIPVGGNVIDLCGVCGGDNSTCKDCAGVPNGGAVIDACGLCGGDGKSRIDCLGVLGGSSKFDKCGVCAGINACLDCSGSANGNAVIDCCGICGGDGSTCLDKCIFYDLKPARDAAQKSMQSLLASVNKYSTQEKRCKKARAKTANDRVKKAKKLMGDNASALAIIPLSKVKSCDTPFCKKTSFAAQLKKMTRAASNLYKLSREAQYGAGSACNSNKVKTAGSQRNAQADHDRAKAAIASVPAVACNN